MNNNFESKYIKYKKKYLDLKKLLGGTPIKQNNETINPPDIKKNRRRRMIFTTPWIDLYDVGDNIFYNNEYYKIIGKNNSSGILTISPVDKDPDLIIPISINDRFKIKPINQRKILLYGGCMCPPHNGHLSLIKTLSNSLIGQDDMLFIGLDGDSLRHNFKTEWSIKIIDRFIKLNNLSSKVKVFNIGSEIYGFPQLEVIPKIDTLTYKDSITVVYGEDYIGERDKLLKQKIKEVEDDYSIDIQSEIKKRDPTLSSTVLSRIARDFVDKNLSEEDFDVQLKSFIPEVFYEKDLSFVSQIKGWLIESAKN